MTEFVCNFQFLHSVQDVFCFDRNKCIAHKFSNLQMQPQYWSNIYINVVNLSKDSCVEQVNPMDAGRLHRKVNCCYESSKNGCLDSDCDYKETLSSGQGCNKDSCGMGNKLHGDGNVSVNSCNRLMLHNNNSLQQELSFSHEYNILPRCIYVPINKAGTVGFKQDIRNFGVQPPLHHSQGHGAIKDSKDYFQAAIQITNTGV